MDTPTFFATIPAAVRYDKGLKPAEKLLFAEISALTNVTGYCYASNAYFETLFDASTRTVQGWLKNLQARGFISITQIGGGPGEPRAERRISPLVGMACVPQTPAEICATPAENCGGTPAKKCAGPPQKSAGRLIQDINTREINIEPLAVLDEFAGDDQKLHDALHAFYDNRKETKKPMTRWACVVLCTTLSKMVADAKVKDRTGYMVAALNESIMHGWQGVFAPKDFVDHAPVVHSPGGAAPKPRQIRPDDDISQYF